MFSFPCSRAIREWSRTKTPIEQIKQQLQQTSDIKWTQKVTLTKSFSSNDITNIIQTLHARGNFLILRWKFIHYTRNVSIVYQGFDVTSIFFSMSKCKLKQDFIKSFLLVESISLVGNLFIQRKPLLLLKGVPFSESNFVQWKPFQLFETISVSTSRPFYWKRFLLVELILFSGSHSCTGSRL